MIDRREARRQAKERVTAKGILVVRCAASGEAWVTSSRDLKASETGLRFGLRIGGHINKAMQAAWNAHGADAFQFEVIESLADDLNPMTLNDTLRDRQKYWLKELAARPV